MDSKIRRAFARKLIFAAAEDAPYFEFDSAAEYFAEWFPEEEPLTQVVYQDLRNDELHTATISVGWVPPLHNAEGDTPMLDDYAYASTGMGVHRSAVLAVIEKWTAMGMGDPTAMLRGAGTASMLSIENIARNAALAAIMAVEQRARS